MNTVKKFTLLEVLVVIAIIGILASILIPVLSSARARARQIACVSNEKQIAIAIYNFADDNDDRAPDNAGTGRVDGWLGKRGIKTLSSNAGKVTRRSLNQYLGYTQDGVEVSVANCGVNDPVWGDDVGKNNYHYDYGSGSSYSGTDNLVDETSNQKLQCVKISTIASPSKFIFLLETGGRNFLRGKNWGTNWHHSPEGENKWNSLYADGHVSYTRLLSNTLNTVGLHYTTVLDD